jgi:hypothetical protein
LKTILPGQIPSPSLGEAFCSCNSLPYVFLTKYASENVSAGIPGNKKEDKIGLKHKLCKYLKFARHAKN